MMIDNPYAVSSSDPRLLVGRAPIFETIISLLNNGENGEALVLEGNHRFGKSIILKSLKQRLSPESWLVIYFDCHVCNWHSERPGIPTEEIWLSLCDALTAALLDEGSDSDVDWARQHNGPDEKYTADTFDALLTKVNAVLAPRRVLFLLDEFDKLQIGVDNRVTSPEVFPHLEHLVSERNLLSFIVAATPVRDSVVTDLWREHFSKNTPLRVSFLMREETDELIALPVAGEIQFLEEALDEVFRITNGQPFLVQFLGGLFFEEVIDCPGKAGCVTRLDIESVTEKIIRVSRDNLFFRGIWNDAGNLLNRRILLAIADAGNAGLSLSEIESGLSDQGAQEARRDEFDRGLSLLDALDLIESEPSNGVVRFKERIPIVSKWIQHHRDALLRL